jgi:pimeloyl-ACP methyl ester carboxylesterase
MNHVGAEFILPASFYPASAIGSALYTRQTTMLPEPHETGYFITVPPDVRLHVVTAGPHQGRPLIFLHGFPEFWWSWRFQLRFFADKGYRVIAPDIRGFNFSDKPAAGYDPQTLAGDVVALMDDMHIESATIIGSDYGGIVAYTTAILHPARVNALVTLNALHPALWPIPSVSGKVGVRIFWLMGRLGHALGKPALNVVNQTLGVGWVMHLLAVNRKAWPQTVRASYSEAFRRSSGTATHYARDSTSWFYRYVPDDLRVSQPVLVLWSKNDVTAPLFWITRSITETIPQAELQVIDQAGHWLQQEQPEAVNEAMLQFLSRHHAADPTD